MSSSSFAKKRPLRKSEFPSSGVTRKKTLSIVVARHDHPVAAWIDLKGLCPSPDGFPNHKERQATLRQV